MSKSGRNREHAKEKIARIRAEEARRKRRRLWLGVTGAAVVVIAAVVGITLAVTGGGSSGLPLASRSTLGTLQPAPPAGPLGPEAVPVPAAAPLASTATAATGQTVDGIGCQAGEQTLFHIHAHLTIFVNGSARQVPAAVGIPGAQVQQSPAGPFIASGSCFYWLHTHAADGTTAGFDLELIRTVRAVVAVPVIASGGAGALAHFAPAVDAGADAVLAASVFHFGTLRIGQVKNTLRDAGHPVR